MNEIGGSENNEGITNESVQGTSELTTETGTSEVTNSGFETISLSSVSSNENLSIQEIPLSIEQAQVTVESYHSQSISQILENNGKYMKENDIARIENGIDNIKAVEHNPSLGRTGGYLFYNGKSSIEVSAINNQQMERSTKHETNHFASKNREIIVPDPEKNGYTVYQTVGLRHSSWFHSNETGENSNYISNGRGLNEGLTTMFTNQQLTELSKEKGEAAERQGIYVHATELSKQLESLVGEDALKEAYYGGNTQKLERRVNALGGEKTYDVLRYCFDKTISKNYAERVQAMKEAQGLMAKMYEKMYENGGYRNA